MPHTPGPWTVGAANDIRTPDETRWFTQRWNTTKTREALEADARLIAAAPDLLTSLKDVLTICTMFDRANLKDMQGRFDSARAAIAKAEGRS